MSENKTPYVSMTAIVFGEKLANGVGGSCAAYIDDADEPVIKNTTLDKRSPMATPAYDEAKTAACLMAMRIRAMMKSHGYRSATIFIVGAGFPKNSESHVQEGDLKIHYVPADNLDEISDTGALGILKTRIAGSKPQNPAQNER